MADMVDEYHYYYSVPVAVGFEETCPYFLDTARGLPLFRVIERKTAVNRAPIRDSFGEGVYIEASSTDSDFEPDSICSHHCRCRRLGQMPSHFAFIVSKHRAGIMIQVLDRRLQEILEDVIGPERGTLTFWDGADVVAHYRHLQRRLQIATTAPAGSFESQSFLPLKLLVDGFLIQIVDHDILALEEKFRWSWPRDVGRALMDVLPEECNDIQVDELLAAARISHRHIQDVINAGVDINTYDSGGNTALIRAASIRNFTAAKLLVRARADIAWANNQGKTAMHIAVEAGDGRIVSLLIGKGADVNAKDNSGVSPALLDTIRDTGFIPGTWQRGGAWSMPTKDVESFDDLFKIDFRTSPSPPQINFHKTKNEKAQEVKRVMREFFNIEYHKVKHHMIFRKIRGRFSNPLRAWRFGLSALRKISNGYLPGELGMAMALLCVCRAVSQTLHAYGHDSSQLFSYPEQFERDLSRWLDIFYGAELLWFKDAAGDIWGANWSMYDTLHLGYLDYHDLFEQAERLVSSLMDAAESLFALSESVGQGQVEQFPDRVTQERQPPPKDPDPDPGISLSQYPRTTMEQPVQPYRSWRWAVLIVGTIFSILLIYLLWLYGSLAGQAQCIIANTSGPHIGADAFTVAMSMRSNLVVSDAQPTQDIQSVTDVQDVVNPRLGNNDSRRSHSRERPNSSSMSQRRDNQANKKRILCKTCNTEITRKNFKRHQATMHATEKKHCETCNKWYKPSYFKDHKCNPAKPFNPRTDPLEISRASNYRL